CQQDYNPPYSF
nr:immunoglobulin light chain junction region [Macaca mulatta]MOX23874.1 immunoglobulin light chain junction region [Macaca mulatta]MOX24062.1 immunoglobulin light chain junction region [Macaca mulatta]MOX24104.1 immunoglobulin light chain junction region [Macaca mulatta]MOX24117.1 immunoglobulin light chain junction region [Macaca mulatta]